MLVSFDRNRSKSEVRIGISSVSRQIGQTACVFVWAKQRLPDFFNLFKSDSVFHFVSYRTLRRCVLLTVDQMAGRAGGHDRLPRVIGFRVGVAILRRLLPHGRARLTLGLVRNRELAR